MQPAHLIAGPVVDCIASGRDPTLDELFRVAERIWSDIKGDRSAFAWERLPANGEERVFSLKAAQVALRGTE